MSTLRNWSRRKAEKEKAIQRAKDAVAEIDAAGVQVKDLDIGLLDFPCMVDGDVVLLCWKMGEKGITHYHGTSEGFAGRKPIDGRISRGPKEQLIAIIAGSDPGIHPGGAEVTELA